MKFITWVETRLGGRTLEVREVAEIERTASGIDPEELGLTLQDGKTVLKQVQEQMVRTQVELISVAWQPCMHCHRDQRIKDLRSRRIRTVFGAVDVFCRRYVRCTCRGGKPWIMWPLRLMALKCSTPELRYLLAKWGSKVPYRRVVELFKEFLPLADDVLSHVTVRRHTLAVGERLDQRATEPSEYDRPESRRQPVPASQRLTVAIDGT